MLFCKRAHHGQHRACGCSITMAELRLVADSRRSMRFAAPGALERETNCQSCLHHLPSLPQHECWSRLPWPYEFQPARSTRDMPMITPSETNAQPLTQFRRSLVASPLQYHCSSSTTNQPIARAREMIAECATCELQLAAYTCHAA